VPSFQSGLKPPPLQPWTPTPIRDPKAIELVTSSVNAMGGTATIGQVKDYVVQAQFQGFAEFGSVPSGQIVWTVAGREYRADYSTPTGTASLSSGNGTPFRNNNGDVKNIIPHAVRSLFVPALVGSVLLAELQDSNYSFEYQGPGSLGSEPVIIVKTSSQASELDFEATPQTWYFDSATSLPVRVEYIIFDSTYWTRSAPGSIDLSDYKAVGGILYPFQVVDWYRETKINTLTITSIRGNIGVPSSVFDFPAGGVQ